MMARSIQTQNRMCTSGDHRQYLFQEKISYEPTASNRPSKLLALVIWSIPRKVGVSIRLNVLTLVVTNLKKNGDRQKALLNKNEACHFGNEGVSFLLQVVWP